MQTTLDSLSLHWREALDAAEDALEAAGRNRQSLQIPVDDLHERTRRLARERSDAEQLLEQVARLLRTNVHRRLTGPRARPDLLGLDPGVRACVFDLDGVLTPSAALHAAAWQETFDPLLARHHESSGERYGPWRPFDSQHDYDRFIHGRPRIEGVHAFLASRGIRLLEGDPEDEPGAETAHGLANLKNEVLRRRLSLDGVSAFAGATRYLETAHEAGLRVAVVSASENTRSILEQAGLDGLVDEVVGGDVMRKEGMRAKPAPDALLAACRELDLPPAEAATFETTEAGIDAGREAGIHRIVCVDRTGRATTLLGHGADRVVSDLSDLIDPALGG